MDLIPINPENYAAALELAVADDQQHLVATVEKSLADAYVYPDALFRLAQVEPNLVGYVMVFPFDQDGQRIVNIVRLMVDVNFQGHGLGRELLTATTGWISTFSPPVGRIRISTLPLNQVALHLYESAGFTRAGMEDGEVVLYRQA